MDDFPREVAALRPQLVAIARKLCRNRDRAEDLVSETVARALANRHAYTDGNLMGWLSTIMRRLHLSERRRDKWIGDDPDGKAAIRLECSPTQFWHTFGADISKAIGALKPDQAKAIIMHCHEGESYEDSAAAIGVGMGAFKSILHRGRLRLQDLLSDDVITPQGTSPMITRTFLVTALVLAVGALTAGNAGAASRCGPIQTVLDALKEQYGEVPAFSGKMQDGTTGFTVTVSPAGSWTMLATPPGSAFLCGITSGKDWAAAKAADPKPEPNALPTPALLEHGLRRI